MSYKWWTYHLWHTDASQGLELAIASKADQLECDASRILDHPGCYRSLVRHHPLLDHKLVFECSIRGRRVACFYLDGPCRVSCTSSVYPVHQN